MWPKIPFGWYVVAAIAIAIALSWMFLPAGLAAAVTSVVGIAALIVIVKVLSGIRWI